MTRKKKKKGYILFVPVGRKIFCSRVRCDAAHGHTEEKSHLVSRVFFAANAHTAVLWHLDRRNRQAKCSSSHDGSLFACRDFIVVIEASLKSPSSWNLFSLLLLLSLSRTSHGAQMLFLSTHIGFEGHCFYIVCWLGSFLCSVIRVTNYSAFICITLLFLLLLV